MSAQLAALQSSRSLKLTAPFRRFGSALRRLLRRGPDGAGGGYPAYLIVTLERTGSNLLCHGLGRIPGGGIPEEWFGYTDLHARAEEVGATLPGSTMEAPELTSLQRYVGAIAARQVSRNGAFGSKVHRYQYARLEGDGLAADPLDLLPAERRDDARLVLLTRKDRRRQAISTFLARNTGVYAHTLEEDGSGLKVHKNPYWPGPQVDPAEDPAPALDAILTQIVADEEGWRRWCEGCGRRCSRVTLCPSCVRAEDYAETVARATARVAGLEVDPDAVPGRVFQRQGGEDNERLLRLWGAG